MQLSNKFKLNSLLLDSWLPIYLKLRNFPVIVNFFRSICSVLNNYPFLEGNGLKTELIVLYEREELQAVLGAITFLTLVPQDKSRCTFQEIDKNIRDYSGLL